MEIDKYKKEIISEKMNIGRESDILLPPGVNIIIDDIGIQDGVVEKIKESLKVDTLFLNRDQLSGLLALQIERQALKFFGKSVAVLYPESGGLKVKKSLNIEKVLKNSDVDQYSIKTKRPGPNLPPYLELPSDLISKISADTYDTILIADDVVVTGNTINEIQRQIFFQTDKSDDDYEPSLRFNYGSPSFKRIDVDWAVASWLTYAGKSSEKAYNLRKINSVMTGIYYKGVKGQPPVNSLSTWIYDKDKGGNVLEKYSEKYSENSKDFVTYINNLRR